MLLKANQLVWGKSKIRLCDLCLRQIRVEKKRSELDFGKDVCGACSTVIMHKTHRFFNIPKIDKIRAENFKSTLETYMELRPLGMCAVLADRILRGMYYKRDFLSELESLEET